MSDYYSTSNRVPDFYGERKTDCDLPSHKYHVAPEMEGTWAATSVWLDILEGSQRRGVKFTGAALQCLAINAIFQQIITRVVSLMGDEALGTEDV